MDPLQSSITATAAASGRVLQSPQPPYPRDREGLVGDTVRASFVLPAALACGIESVVAEQRDPRTRAAAISALVDEIYQLAVWVHGGDVGHAELASLAQLLNAARAHEARIAIVDLGGVA